MATPQEKQQALNQLRFLLEQGALTVESTARVLAQVAEEYGDKATSMPKTTMMAREVMVLLHVVADNAQRLGV